MQTMENEIMEFLLKCAKFDEKIWQCTVSQARDKLYQDLGHVDSLSFISFISAIETNYDIEFTFEELESEKFRTLNGVCKIIEAKVKS